LGGHSVAGDEVDGDADEEEESAVGEGVEVDVDDGRPFLRARQGQRVLAHRRRREDCLGWCSFGRWSACSADLRWVLSTSRGDKFGDLAAGMQIRRRCSGRGSRRQVHLPSDPLRKRDLVVFLAQLFRTLSQPFLGRLQDDLKAADRVRRGCEHHDEANHCRHQLLCVLKAREAHSYGRRL